MIKLTKLNGKEFYLNSNLIETLEETPDTVVTLTNGNFILVSEKIEVIREKTIEYNRELWKNAFNFGK